MRCMRPETAAKTAVQNCGKNAAMRKLVPLLLGFVLGCRSEAAPDPTRADPAKPAKESNDMGTKFSPNDVVLDHEVTMLDGTTKKLSEYRGKAVLVVNTASECGYTPQYADLQSLYGQYRERGLEVVAFPSDDFGGQEPGNAEEIRQFVDDKYAVEFAMFDKVHAKGPDISAVYRTLSEQTGAGIAGEVKWNFTKFLVDPKGRVVARFEPNVRPTDPEVIAEIERVLPQG
jgi:glutathione peroxidase